MVRRGAQLAFLCLLVASGGVGRMHAQGIAITSITKTALTDPDGAGTTTVNSTTGTPMVFQNATQGIASFSTATTTFNVASLANQGFVRRNSVNAQQSSIWYANATTPTTERLGAHVANYQGGVGSIMLANDLTRGSDNTFANGNTASDGNIERMDFVFTSGLSVSQGLAFAVLDRGAAGGHDPFKIAAITGWDSVNNVPTSYGTLVSQAANWGATNAVANFGYTLLRYSASDNGGDANNLATHNASAAGTNQGLEGVLFTGSALGLSNGQTIYGYSLFASDVTGSGSTLIDYTNATYFPTNTAGAGAGGIDLAAVNGLSLQDIAFSPVPEPSTYALAGVVVMVGGAIIHRRRRAIR